MATDRTTVWKFFGTLALAFTISGCAGVKIPGVGGTSGAPSADGEKAVNVTGTWNVGFKYNDETLNASMQLKQDGSGFDGTGKDDPSGTVFKIEQGQVRGDQVSFVKKYGGKLANVPPIQYAGSISQMSTEDYSGPYMKGDYAAQGPDGKTVSNDWDAVQEKPAQSIAASRPTASEAPAPQKNEQPSGETHPDKAPDLSGKWEVAYEYKFRTVKSIMFLEQEFDRVIGHGLDDTKEKFVLEKVFYSYPKITLIRKYSKSAEKVKGKTKEVGKDRLMTFKGDVSVVNDADYQGPYLRGKTDGGGAWEAQRVK